MASSIRIPEHGSSKESFNKKWYKVEDDTSNICEESYAARKQHKKPFYISNSRAKRALELVHADICDSMQKTSLGVMQKIF